MVGARTDVDHHCVMSCMCNPSTQVLLALKPGSPAWKSDALTRSLIAATLASVARVPLDIFTTS